MRTKQFSIPRGILERLSGVYRKVGQYRYQSTNGTVVRIPPFPSGRKNAPPYQILYVDPSGNEHRVSGVFTDPARFDAPTDTGTRFHFRIYRLSDGMKIHGEER